MRRRGARVHAVAHCHVEVVPAKSKSAGQGQGQGQSFTAFRAPARDSLACLGTILNFKTSSRIRRESMRTCVRVGCSGGLLRTRGSGRPASARRGASPCCTCGGQRAVGEEIHFSSESVFVPCSYRAAVLLDYEFKILVLLIASSATAWGSCACVLVSVPHCGGRVGSHDACVQGPRGAAVPPVCRGAATHVCRAGGPCGHSLRVVPVVVHVAAQPCGTRGE